MKLQTINFDELSNYNDSNSIVFAGTLISDDDVEDICTFPTEIGLAPADKHVVGIYKILGNVKGDKGRVDWLIVFDREDIQFNFITRLKYRGWIKWTSDFICNYYNDYNL